MELIQVNLVYEFIKQNVGFLTFLTFMELIQVNLVYEFIKQNVGFLTF